MLACLAQPLYEREKQLPACVVRSRRSRQPDPVPRCRESKPGHDRHCTHKAATLPVAEPDPDLANEPRGECPERITVAEPSSRVALVSVNTGFQVS
jgi:hypothetical protein